MIKKITIAANIDQVFGHQLVTFKEWPFSTIKVAFQNVKPIIVKQKIILRNYFRAFF